MKRRRSRGPACPSQDGSDTLARLVVRAAAWLLCSSARRRGRRRRHGQQRGQFLVHAAASPGVPRRLRRSAQAIRLSTMAWPDTISMTMMKAVIGPCVVAARKPTMPSAIKRDRGLAGPGRRAAPRRGRCPRRWPATGANMPAGHAGPGRQPGGAELQQRVDAGQVGLALEQRACRRVACAGRGAAGDDADHGHPAARSRRQSAADGRAASG